MLPVATTCLELKGIMLSETKEPLKYREKIGGCQRQRVKSEQNGWRGRKIQTSSYKINRSWGVMCSIVAVVNNTVLYTWKLLRVNLKRYYHKKKLWWHINRRWLAGNKVQMRATELHRASQRSLSLAGMGRQPWVDTWPQLTRHLRCGVLGITILSSFPQRHVCWVASVTSDSLLPCWL